MSRSPCQLPPGRSRSAKMIVRTKLSLEPSSGQLVLEGSSASRAVQGISAARATRLSMTLDRGGLLYNPTACRDLQAVTTLTGFTPATADSPTRSLSSPVAISGCGALGFKPSVAAASNAKALRGLRRQPRSERRSAPLASAREGAAAAAAASVHAAFGHRRPGVPRKTFDAQPAGVLPARHFVGERKRQHADAGGEAGRPRDPGTAPPDEPTRAVPGAPGRRRAAGARGKLQGARSGAHASPTSHRTLDVPISNLKLNLPSGAHLGARLRARARGVCPLPLTTCRRRSPPGAVRASSSRRGVRQLECGVRIVEAQGDPGDTAPTSTRADLRGRTHKRQRARPQDHLLATGLRQAGGGAARGAEHARAPAQGARCA